MLTVIKTPTIIESIGHKPKRIEEYVGRINSATETLSIAKMMSAGGWEEPGQTPEFDEYTLVLAGRGGCWHEFGLIIMRGPERQG